MCDGVLYINVGLKHAIHLAVSIYSLRKWWDGPVAIACGDDSAEEIGHFIAGDPELRPVTIIRFDHEDNGRGSTYATKCRMGEFSPFERTVFIDADTLIVGDFRPMFPAMGGVTLTQFSDWVSTGRMISGRVEKWRHVCDKMVNRMLECPYPAINTGVMGFTSSSTDWFEDWKKVTNKNISFICDEIAAQLIFPDHAVKVLDDRFNCSPTYSWGTGDVRIWHGHGFRFLKKETGRQLWLPVFKEALVRDTAKLQSWFKSVPNSPEESLWQTRPENA